MARFVNAVNFNPTLGGTTDWVVTSAVAGFMTPALAGAVTGVYKYRAESADLTQWEIGEGTYTSGTVTLTRTTVLYNSSGTGTGAGQSGAGTKINFTVPPYVAMVQATEDTLALDNNNAFSSTQRAQARQNISAVLNGFLAGLTLSTAGSSIDFGIGTGECASSDGSDLMRLTSSYTKNTGAWVAGTGAGSLDTGTIANSTWYHVFVIKNPTTLTVDVLISLSATSPTLPAGYTLSRRIGSMKTNGSAQWTKFTQNGNDFYWDTSVQDYNTSVLGTSSVLVTLTTPTGVKTKALLRGHINNAALCDVLITSPEESDQAVDAVSGLRTVQNSVAGVGITFGHIGVTTNTSAQIRARSDAASTTLRITTYGWEDTRGASVSTGGNEAAAVLQQYLSGLTLSTAGSSATFAVAAGQATDSGNAYYMTLAASMSKTTSAWAAGSTAGSLDTGAIANNTWYHVYLIRRLDTGAVDVLISLSATTPTMPTNYTLKRRIGSMKTNGSAQWTSFVQLGDMFLWYDPPLDHNGVSLGTTPTNYVISVPTGVNVEARIIAVNSTSGGNRVYVANPSLLDLTVNFTTGNIGLNPGAGVIPAQLDVWTDTSAQVRARAEAAAQSFSIRTLGWKDTLGTRSVAGASSTVPIIQNYLTGLTLSTVGGSSIFSVAAGQATDSGNSEYMALSSSYSKSYGAWAVGGGGQGALDTGTVATNTWYHVYLIKSLSLGIVDVLISLSATSPTMPANYTLKRRIGSMRTEATPVWIKFYQEGDNFIWDAAVSNVAGFTGATTAQTATLTVPTGIKVTAEIGVGTITAAGADSRIYVSSFDKADETLTATNLNAGLTAPTAGQVWQQMDIRTNTSGQIRYRMINSTGSVYINTHGWTDTRGK